MMRFKQALLIFFLASISILGFGQKESISEVQLGSYRTPSNPALSLMGVQPTEITRPKSLKQLETTLLNEFTGDDGGVVIPNDFGMEIMPAWLTSHPSIRFDPTALQKNQLKFWRTLSASLGSVNTTTNDTIQSQIGFGLRTQLLSGTISASDINTIQRLSAKLKELQNDDSKILSSLIQAEINLDKITSYQALSDYVAADLKKSNPADAADLVVAWNSFFSKHAGPANLNTELSEDEAGVLIRNLTDAIDGSFNSESNAELVDSIKNIRAERSGIIWEVAAATYLDFPTGQFSNSSVPKFGAWTTLTYRTDDQRFDFLGTVRYIEDFGIEDRTWNLDGGVSIVCNIGKLAFTGEYLQRYQQRSIVRTMATDGFDLEKTDSGWDYRATINASYHFSDKLVLNYSFGKRFDFSDQAQNNLVSQLSLNVGLGNIPIKLE